MRAFAVFLPTLLVAVIARSPWPQSAYERAGAKLATLSATEKFSMLHGHYFVGGYVGNGEFLGDPVALSSRTHPKVNPVPGNKTSGIPPMYLEDGPQGVADGTTLVTAWPSALTVTMSWDTELAEAWGAAMGAEQSIKGTNVMLGPAVNLARVPWAGRNFEYMGEQEEFWRVAERER